MRRSVNGRTWGGAGAPFRGLEGACCLFLDHSAYFWTVEYFTVSYPILVVAIQQVKGQHVSPARRHATAPGCWVRGFSSPANIYAQSILSWFSPDIRYMTRRQKSSIEAQFLSILGNPLVNVLKSYFVVLDTSPRRRCVAGAYVRCVDLFSCVLICINSMQPVVLGRKSMLSAVLSHEKALPNTFEITKLKGHVDSPITASILLPRRRRGIPSWVPVGCIGVDK